MSTPPKKKKAKSHQSNTSRFVWNKYIEKLLHLEEQLLIKRSLDEKLKIITEGVVDIFNAEFARIWMVKASDLCEKGCLHTNVSEGADICRDRRNCLHLVASSGRYTNIDGGHRRVPMGCYKIGRVASGEDIKFITNDVTHDPRVHDHEWAKSIGLVSFAGYRLLTATGQPIGVLALFSKHALVYDEETLLQDLANTTSHIIVAAMAEEALQDKTDELNRYFTLSLDLLCIADTNGYFRRLNPEWEKTLGYNLNELEGKPFLDYVHPDDLEATLAVVSQLVRQEEVLNFRNRYRHKDGSYIWLEWRSYPMGELIYAVARDITDKKHAEEELLKSEERYRRITQAITDYIYSTRIQNGKVIETKHGPGCISVTGYSVQEFARNPFLWISMVYPEDKTRVEEQSRRILSEGYSGAIEHRIFRKDGTLRWVRNTPVLYYDKNGSLSGYDGLIQDITERKQIEETMRLEKQFTETLLESLPGLFYLYEFDIQSPANSRLIRFNMKHSTLTGYTPDELQGMNIKDWFEPDMIKEAVRAISIIGERGEAQANLILRMKDGSQVPYAFTGRSLNIDDKMYFLGMGIDISDFVRTQEALKESEMEYRLVVENANDAIYIIQDGMIKFPNPQLTNLTGYTEEEITKVPFSSFIHPEDKGMVIDRHRRRLRGEDVPSTYSLRIISKAGETLWVEAGTVLIDWEGRTAVLTFLRDITVQKKLEEQLLQARKMEAIGTLAGGIAHDFNNLLTGILGYTYLMLMKTEKSHPFYEKLKIIEQQVVSGSELTKQLLGFARGGKYDVRPVNVNDLIIKTSEIFGRMKKEITIHRKLREDLCAIEADTGQIEQVLLNLYVNAWQAMPAGGELYLESGNTILDEQESRPFNSNPGRYVKISVTDTGLGMDSETQKRIFEPFFSTKGIGKGTGLGLASAYGIIKNHGGIINVYSEKGHGTTFTIYLPASVKEAVETKPAEERMLTGDETILVVDDEKVNIAVIKELLEKLGYKILTAQTGKKALELYRKHSKDIKLVILDMIMPEMNGKETLVKLMEIDKEVRVLLSSGYSINGEAAKILEMGCRGFIQKPFRVEELSRKIRTVLDAGHS
jgi:two-component system, cell cycle sensor histidine kinase and response regulator CckA